MSLKSVSDSGWLIPVDQNLRWWRCLFVCLSVWLHNSKTTRLNFIIFISAKWTEWNKRRSCFYFCVCVCVSVRTQSHWFEWAERRIVFDSCVKSWEYFRTVNMSLETFYWLSDDIVRFKIEVGVEEKCTKTLTSFPMDFPHTPEHAVIIDDVIIIGRHLLCTYITSEARM